MAVKSGHEKYRSLHNPRGSTTWSILLPGGMLVHRGPGLPAVAGPYASRYPVHLSKDVLLGTKFLISEYTAATRTLPTAILVEIQRANL